ncbi:MAG: reactive intermediate/imine deaminase [Thalassobius sp.]|nr:reactive intermediate/imine deaminase [Thalassovita sp.]
MRTSYAFFLLLLTFACSAPKNEKIEEEKPVENKREIVKSEKAPLPIGPYNQGIVVGNTLHTAGQIAINAETGEMVTDSIEAEATQVLDNLKSVIEEAGYTMDEVVQTTIYMTDLADFSKVNEIYGSYFKEGQAPARVTVQVAAIPKNAHLEISMVAMK